MKKLIKKLRDWWNEEETLGCPDPEMHDRNNEFMHGEVVCTAFNFNQPTQG